MNPVATSNELAEVACEVIDTIAFAFSEVCPPGESSLPDVGVLRVEVHFTGHAVGSIRLEASYDAATTIAGNLLGLDSDEITDQQALEGCCELLNIVAGQWLTRAYGVKAVFQLGIPEPCEASDPLEQVVDLLVEDQPVRLHLQVAG